MKTKKIWFTCCLSFLLLHSAEGQDVQNIGRDLPQLTTEQKLDRAVMNALSYMRMGIAYAKSQGASAAVFGAYGAELASPFYEQLKGQPPIAVVYAMYTVQQTDTGFQIEILESSETTVRARMTLYGLQYLRPSDGFGGVTISDCYAYYNAFMETFASSLDLQYSFTLEQDWINFSLQKRM